MGYSYCIFCSVCINHCPN
ncbi:4Fe-4S binding protein [uncultured Paraglaciecola sp.]